MPPRRQRLRRQLPQSAHAQQRRALLALGSTLQVFAARQPALAHRIADHHSNAVGNFDRARRKVAAVQQQRASLAPQARRVLIQNPALHPHELVLGLLAQQRLLLRRHAPSAQCLEHGGQRALDRGRRAQPAFERHRTLDHGVAAAEREALVLEDRGDAPHIIAPPGAGDRSDRVQPELVRRVQVHRVNPHDAVVPAPRGDPCVAADRQRQDEAQVVVRVAAHEVHAPRCARPQFGLASELLAEPCRHALSARPIT